MTCANTTPGYGQSPCHSGQAPRTGMTQVLLREIAARLAALVSSGQGDAIDLRSLPMTEVDRSELEACLGQGEVSAVVTVVGLEAGGASEIWETAVSGVWWVRHRGADGSVASEEIVVARIPDILTTHHDDTRAGLARLAAQIADHDQSLRPQGRPQQDRLELQQEGR